MKRKVVTAIALFSVLLSIVPITSSAHSGKTDSNGGHYNRSTGEYHYHHGYSAHDHYDMDGDGSEDCPYKFDYSSSGGGVDIANNAYYSGYDVGYESGYDSGRYEADAKYKSEIDSLKKEFEDSKSTISTAFFIFGAVVTFPIAMFLTSAGLHDRQKKEIEKLEKESSISKKQKFLMRLVEDVGGCPIENMLELLYITFMRNNGIPEDKAKADLNKKLESANLK